jgi:hypothetical protein
MRSAREVEFRRHLASLLILGCSLLLMVGGAFAQANITGSISGTVTDSSGAVIPNATVTVTSVDQDRVERVLKTDGNGAYSVPVIPAGRYSIAVDAQGFKKTRKTGIVINVADKRTESFVLQVGASSETVNVEAAPVQVNLTNSTGSELVTGTQVRELTINNRNYVNLLTLSPGVSSTTPEGSYVGTTNPVTGAVNVIGFSVNGQRTSANNWTIDGADNVDRGSNLTLLSTPSVDTIAEFKLVRSNYDAEYGRAGAGQVQVITRSGTSSYHGGAYEFWKNNQLNADNYMTKRGRYTNPPSFCSAFVAAGNPQDCDTRPLLRYHNFGYTLGGPVPLGSLKKNTFFFFSHEFRRVITYSTQVATMPTAAELTGTFNVPVCVTFAANGSCTSTSTTISPASFSPTAAAYIKDIYSKVPLSTDPVTHLTTNYFNAKSNFREESVKVDHNFGERLRVYGRYLHDDIPTTEPLGIFGPNALIPNVAPTATNSPGWSLVGHATWTKSPTLLIDVGYNFSYGAIISYPTGLTGSTASPDIKPTLLYPVTTAVVPSLSFTSSMSALGTRSLYLDYNRNHQFFGNLTKVHGKHTFKFGGTFYKYQKTENAAGNNGGSFAFTGAQVTGSGLNANCTAATLTAGISNSRYCIAQGWANFLLGRVNTFSQVAVDLTPDVRQNSFEFFGQDEWRVTPRLTLSLGVRYSIFRQPYDANGYLTTFDPRYFNPAIAFTMDTAAGSAGNRILPVLPPGSNYCLNPANAAQCLNGIIPTTSAIKKCAALFATGQTSTACWPDGTKAPFGNKVANEDMGDVAPRIAFAWDPWGDGKTSVRAGAGFFYDTPLVGIIEQNVFANPPFSYTPSISNTNFDNPGTGVVSTSAAPISLSGRMQGPWRSPRTYQYNLSVQHQYRGDIFVDIGYFGNVGRNLIGLFEQNQPPVGAYVGTTADASVGVAIASNPCGANTTAPCVNSASNPRLNNLRPYRGYLAINGIRSIFNSNYSSLQTSVRKQFRTGSTFGLAYTWSHALTDNQTDRSSAPQNSYNIRGDYGPTQQDRRHILTANYVWMLPWFREQHGIFGHILGGWENSGIITAQSGTPFTVTGVTIDRAGESCLTSASPCSARPDIIADPNVGGPHTIAQWFNTAAFAQVPAGQIRPGTARRGDVIGPGFWRVDMSMMKNIKFTERVTGQFRIDAFNALNHTNFNAFGSTALNSSLFGQISTATGGVRDPRNVQLGLKINF